MDITGGEAIKIGEFVGTILVVAASALWGAWKGNKSVEKQVKPINGSPSLAAEVHEIGGSLRDLKETFHRELKDVSYNARRAKELAESNERKVVAIKVHLTEQDRQLQLNADKLDRHLRESNVAPKE